MLGVRRWRELVADRKKWKSLLVQELILYFYNFVLYNNNLFSDTFPKSF